MIEVMFEVMRYFGLNHRPSSGVKWKLNELRGFTNPEIHITKQKIAVSLLICQQQQQHVMDGNINSFRLRVFRQ